MPKEERALRQKHSRGQMGEAGNRPAHPAGEAPPTPPMQGPAQRYRDGAGEGGASTWQRRQRKREGTVCFK